MKLPIALADVPMTVTHFRLIWRHFGTTPALRDAILDGTGMSEAALATAQTVTVGQLCQLIANMNRLHGPCWYLEAREQLHFSAHGAITVAALSAQTFADAMAVLTTFVEVRLPMIRARLTVDGATAKLTFEPAGDFRLDHEIMRPIILTSVISVHTLMASTLAHPARAACLLVGGPPPAYVATLQAAFGGTVQTGAATDGLSFPAEWLAAPSALADPALYADAIANLNALAAARARPPRGLRHRIEQLLAEQAAGRLDADAVARALGLSRRTMTRRLAEEGTGFRQLLDHDLRRRALAMVETGSMTNARIADMLGYQNPTSFHRAMQRWTRPGA